MTSANRCRTSRSSSHMSSWIHAFVAVTMCVALCDVVSALNNRPIIGILTQPTGPSLQPYGTSYLAASYVKWMESAGARVVPIPYDADQQTLSYLFSSVNGLVFPGGGSDIDHTQLYYAAEYLVQLATAEAQKGVVFPIHGTCMGFELLFAISNGGDCSCLTQFDAENITLPLTMVNNWQKSGIFGSAPQNVMQVLVNKPATMNNHMWGISPASFNASSSMQKFWNVLSTNKDREGNVFISTVENQALHITGTQWHPEKPQFEWNPKAVIQHDADSLMANFYIAQYIVAQARQNNHAFPSPQEESKWLIYNWSPLYTASVISDFQQCYVWQ